jgi:hypothetical protein
MCLTMRLLEGRLNPSPQLIRPFSPHAHDLLMIMHNL